MGSSGKRHFGMKILDVKKPPEGGFCWSGRMFMIRYDRVSSTFADDEFFGGYGLPAGQNLYEVNPLFQQ